MSRFLDAFHQKFIFAFLLFILLPPVCSGDLLLLTDEESIPIFLRVRDGYLFHRRLTFKGDDDNDGSSLTQDEICKLQAEVGPCDDNMLQWYHELKSGTCKVFSWGGCQGNQNRFTTLTECEEGCGVTPGSSKQLCRLPAVQGTCPALFRKWYHNVDSGTCKKFIYGGCGGNDNLFDTLAECEFACEATSIDPSVICSLQPDKGSCNGDFQQWYHDVNTATCKEFSWSGCDGNQNNFDTIAECQRFCEVDVCSLLPDVGPCEIRLERARFSDTEDAMVTETDSTL